VSTVIASGVFCAAVAPVLVAVTTISGNVSAGGAAALSCAWANGGNGTVVANATETDTAMLSLRFMRFVSCSCAGRGGCVCIDRVPNQC
jgi:hypothetical protein